MSDVQQELGELNKAIGKAEVERDVAFLDKHLAGDLLFRRANGSIAPKEEYLQSVSSPNSSYEFVYCDDVEVLLCGEDTALVSLLVWAKGKRGPTSFDGIYRNTRLFLKRDGRWQCALWFNRTLTSF